MHRCIPKIGNGHIEEMNGEEVDVAFNKMAT